MSMYWLYVAQSEIGVTKFPRLKIEYNSKDKELNFDTIWSSVFDITNNEIYRAEGNPLRAKYIEDKRLFK